ncbi:MAG: indolepyruvate oxidoreductase subunit beta family protein [Proteobacteria bacterium]|nr:indolepyruvate oxidoreductase subunit beta family protein [Pseudomonadota bacterium]
MIEDTRQRITIAIAAIGGQGGAVLADWLVDIGESNGYFVQSTSVPGVAQRTGTTIYYLEMFPEVEGLGTPVMALMPVAGDVDIVVAAELAEAGRAVQRGIVTPDRTTLIASDHRYYALSEKSALGDGRVSSVEIKQAISDASKRLICFDMQALAETHNTVISATLFGALAGSARLPFAPEHFEAAITASGKSVANNLSAFRSAYAIAQGRDATPIAESRVAWPQDATDPEVSALLDRVATEIMPQASEIVLIGVRRLIDYQDPTYATSYLDRVVAIQKCDREDDRRLTRTVAQHLALWMSYEDSIRVADLKIRRERFDRTRAEVLASEDEIVYLTEFMHPRVEEVADTLPVSLGRWLVNTEWARQFLSQFVLREHKIHSSKLGGYLLLYGIASLQRFRRRTLRFAIENDRIQQWLQRISTLAGQHYDLAVEVTLCQNLIKGYGDTHARGVRNFALIMDSLNGMNISPSTASEIAKLRTAALADENGDQLRNALRVVA